MMEAQERAEVFTLACRIVAGVVLVSFLLELWEGKYVKR